MNVSCPWCNEDSGVPGDFDHTCKEYDCGVCGKRLYVYSDEDYDSNYWFAAERVTDQPSPGTNPPDINR